MREIVVPRVAAGVRLDRFLSGLLGVSRSELQRWIAAGRVTVQGRAGEAAARLREGERVHVDPMSPAASQARPDSAVSVDVVYLDDELVVVNKPSGLVVHPARGHASGTLVNGLLAMGLFRSLEDGETERPGVVHRLDKGTSGVMVVARTAEAREALKAQFSAHTIDRAYEAIVAGEAVDRTFDTLHGRHSRDRMRFTTHVRSGKRAVTCVRVLAGLQGATYVECTLRTGRTHQIRVHLAESGTPVLGDPLYGRPPRDERVRAVGVRLGHQALHARLLGFDHPRTGQRVRFEAGLPEDFRAALEELGADA